MTADANSVPRRRSERNQRRSFPRNVLTNTSAGRATHVLFQRANSNTFIMRDRRSNYKPVVCLRTFIATALVRLRLPSDPGPSLVGRWSIKTGPVSCHEEFTAGSLAIASGHRYLENNFSEKGKPTARWGRNATGPKWLAGLPNEGGADAPSHDRSWQAGTTQRVESDMAEAFAVSSVKMQRHYVWDDHSDRPGLDAAHGN